MSTKLIRLVSLTLALTALGLSSRPICPMPQPAVFRASVETGSALQIFARRVERETVRLRELADTAVAAAPLGKTGDNGGTEPADIAPATCACDVPILLYHNVDANDVPCSGVWVTRHLFAEQMAALDAYGYTTVTLQDFVSYRDGDAVPPDRPIIITFDDGNDNFFTQARPLLNAHGFTATHFLPTGHVGDATREDNSWDPPEAACPTYTLLWSEVAQMQAEGYAFESHSVSHPHLTDLSREVAMHEINASKRDLEDRLGREVRFFAYPYGDGALDQRIRGLVEEAGYRAAVSTQTGVASTSNSDVWALPRIKITEANSIRLDPARPQDFFMRKVDPLFPLPRIAVERIDIVDQAGNQLDATLHPVDAVSVRIVAHNDGAPTDVEASARVVASDGGTPLWDSHADGADVKLHFAANTTQRFEFICRIPADAADRDFSVEFVVFDRHRVLEFFRGGWDALATIHAQEPSASGLSAE